MTRHRKRRRRHRQLVAGRHNLHWWQLDFLNRLIDTERRWAIDLNRLRFMYCLHLNNGGAKFLGHDGKEILGWEISE